MPMVVIRQLHGLRPVTQFIIQESKDPDVIDQKHYMEDIANKNIEAFKEAFPEFKDAKFYMDIIPKGGVL